jgi:peptidoglycan-associated lipoprotein
MHLKLISAIIISCALLVACSSTKPEPQKDAVPTATIVPPSVKETPTAKSTVAQVVIPDHLNPNSLISQNKSVYFDYDKFSIKDEYTPVIQINGKYLTNNVNLKIKVQGNADERGSAEYNLALGQKRADAVAKALGLYGVKDAQIETTSWGREKPIDPGHNEQAWAKNRRADIVYN